MRTAAFVFAQSLLLMPTLAGADTNDALYVCEVTHALHWVEGDLKQDEYSDIVLDRTNHTLRFNAASALLRFIAPQPTQYHIVQYGTSENDILAKREVDGVANYQLSTLRIRAWEDPVSFLHVSNGVVYSGVCREE